LNEFHGVVRIPPEDVRQLKEDPNHGVNPQTYDILDGLPGAPQMSYRSSTAIEAADGRLWFATDNGLAWIDPARMSKNIVPPPVSILSLATDATRYGPFAPLNLPRHTSSLRIEDSALSLSVPERVRFRYKLEGVDTDWQDAGASRQALYRNLIPNKYRFRVTACNEDGFWNTEGAAVEFTIPPAWYQMVLFRIASVVVGLSALWILYRLRVRQIAKDMGDRFDERLEERTRIARELHDTLLQTVQGSKMVADDALDQAADPLRMRRALEQLSAWLGQATAEGRTALHSLRSSATEKNDLAAAFRRAIDECGMRSSMAGHFLLAGEARDMHPVVRDEVYRIGYEAIRNACVHSEGSRLDVVLKYDEDLTLRVSDNGRGIDATVAERGREGHFGLRGMRERARGIGGKFTIATGGSSGTEITLVVPGRIAFQRRPGHRLMD
jgi:signal transduction histidine kinase